MKMKAAKECKCLRCNFTWRSKLNRPKYCPACKQAKWDTLARMKKVAVRPGLKNSQDSVFDAIGAIGKDPATVRDDRKVEPAARVVDSSLDFELV